ncbi:MAG: heme-binding protein, partial [Opitutaceae bacterium]
SHRIFGAAFKTSQTPAERQPTDSSLVAIPPKDTKHPKKTASEELKLGATLSAKYVFHPCCKAGSRVRLAVLMENQLSSSVPASAGASLSPHPQLVAKRGVGLELAKKIAAKAEAEAVKNKWTVVIAVVDDGGNLVLLQKMDGTQLGSIEVAIQKAVTALKFKRPTKAFEDVIVGGRTAVLSLPGVSLLTGGVPLVVEGAYVGAIGVSGMQSNEDGRIAEAGASVLAEP